MSSNVPVFEVRVFYIITNTKEKPSTAIDIFLQKTVMQWKLNEWAKFEWECRLLIFIYSNWIKSFAKTRTLNAGTSGLIPKRNRLKYLTLHSPLCLFALFFLNELYLLCLKWLIIYKYRKKISKNLLKIKQGRFLLSMSILPTIHFAVLNIVDVNENNYH